MRVTVVECEKLPLFPLMVKVYVPGGAFRFTEIVRLELPVVVTGLGLKVALVREGTPLTLRLTELEPPLAPSDTV
jgi:hypothetical protein